MKNHVKKSPLDLLIEAAAAETPSPCASACGPVTEEKSPQDSNTTYLSECNQLFASDVLSVLLNRIQEIRLTNCVSSP
jgi:hypothetical protein